MARVVTISISSNADRIKYTKGLRSSLTGLLQTTVDTFGESSFEYQQVVAVSISVALGLDSPATETRALCKQGISQLAAANSASQEDWGIFTLLQLSAYNLGMAQTFKARDKHLGIFYLLESLSADKVACRKAKEGEMRKHLARRVMQTHIRLIDELVLLGMVEEAAKLRVGLGRSDFLREIRENDLAEMGLGSLS
ncbi:hypothetical protein LZ30DRAFT_601124 [Colletotrichum cereale]|nr:hypothetical protein LZ30DRAFT_601124 [Colletotrichum cereale]